METLQIFALIVLITAAIKLLTLVISAKSWISLIDRVWKYPKLTMVISFILSLYVFIKLIEVVSITEIFAVMLLITLLSAFTMAVYAKEFVAMIHRIARGNLISKAWLAILVWAILITFGIIELL